MINRVVRLPEFWLVILISINVLILVAIFKADEMSASPGHPVVKETVMPKAGRNS